MMVAKPTRFALFLLFLFLTQCALSPQEQKLVQNVRHVLESHLLQGQKWGLKYHFYRPGLEKYGPYQWLWDSCFHMIAWSRLNATNAILDLRTMLQKRDRKSNRVPEMIYWGNQTRKDRLVNKLLQSDQTVTDITQMPMIPFALRRMYEATGKNKTVLEEFLNKVIESHAWWAHERQPDDDGLVVIIHPWQSGMDASPMYDQALRIEGKKQKIWNYKGFIELELSYKYRYRWDQKKILRKKKHPASKQFLNYFIMKEVGVNAVYTYGWKILTDLSNELGNELTTQYCRKQYERFVKGLVSLYDEEKGRYVSKYVSGSEYKKTERNTVQALFPLLIEEIPQKHKDSILSMLQDEKHYKSDYPIPTVSRSDPTYTPDFTIDLMWRGPSWAAPNYFILEALQNSGHDELFREIGEQWVRQALSQGIWQMWHPQTGKGQGVKNLGMSTSVVDVLYRLRNSQ